MNVSVIDDSAMIISNNVDWRDNQQDNQLLNQIKSQTEVPVELITITEFKQDDYGRRWTAKITFEFLFFF